MLCALRHSLCSQSLAQRSGAARTAGRVKCNVNAILRYGYARRAAADGKPKQAQPGPGGNPYGLPAVASRVTMTGVALPPAASAGCPVEAPDRARATARTTTLSSASAPPPFLPTREPASRT